MRAPIKEYLRDILEDHRPNREGSIPDYIPRLAEADPEWLGVALCTTSGHIYDAGDSEVEFTIQSMSKPFVYALAVQTCGVERVLELVGLEPSGEAFNELSLGEDGRPVNAMINAGAIAVNQLVNGSESSVEERVEVIRTFLSRLAGRELYIDGVSAESEFESAERNLSLAHMLRNYGIIADSAHDAVLSYIRQCSVMVSVKDLAVMAATLANGGIQPVTGEEILAPQVARLTLSVMNSSGMYDAAGRWQARVGIPAKSGVSGGIIGMLPGQLGIASLSPLLDSTGNSVRGVKIFEALSEDMGLHLMNPRGEAINLEDNNYSLQGPIDFTATEALFHEVDEDSPLDLDLSEVSDHSPRGLQLLSEGLQRLRDEGVNVSYTDPQGLLDE